MAMSLLLNKQILNLFIVNIKKAKFNKLEKIKTFEKLFVQCCYVF